jgi:hypothetical protein
MEDLTDPSEPIRRARVAELSAEAAQRAELEERYGDVWDVEQMRLRYEVIGFAAPLVVVRDRKSGKLGSLEFQGSPRFYFNWQEDK